MRPGLANLRNVYHLEGRAVAAVGRGVGEQKLEAVATASSARGLDEAVRRQRVRLGHGRGQLMRLHGLHWDRYYKPFFHKYPTLALLIVAKFR